MQSNTRLKRLKNIKVRATLMTVLTGHIQRAGWTQAQAARAFHVTQPRISGVQRGKIALFSVDTLINMTASAGMRVELHIRAAELNPGAAEAMI